MASGVLGHILPVDSAIDSLHNLRVSEQLCGVRPDPMLRLMALMPRSALAVQEVGEALKLSNAEKQRLTEWAADNLPEIVGLRARELRAELFWHGKQAVVDRALLAGTDVRDLLAAVNIWRAPEFPIGGDDALAAGLKGQEIGEALSRVGRVWVDSDFELEREALLALLVQQNN